MAKVKDEIKTIFKSAFKLYLGPLFRNRPSVLAPSVASVGGLQYILGTYQALLKHGKLSASHTSRVSQVPYGKIYEVLASLENKAANENNK